jgi:hypothetical protein
VCDKILALSSVCAPNLGFKSDPPPPPHLHTKSKVSYEVSCIELIVDSPEWLIALSNLQMTIANRTEKIYMGGTTPSRREPPPPPDHHSEGGSRQANLAGGNDMDSEIRFR